MTERRLTPAEERLLDAQRRLTDAGVLVKSWRLVFRSAMGFGTPLRDQLQQIAAERREPLGGVQLNNTVPQRNPNQPLVPERFPRPLLSFVERFRQPVQPQQAEESEPTPEEEKAKREAEEAWHRGELARLKQEEIARVRSQSDFSIVE